MVVRKLQILKYADDYKLISTILAQYFYDNYDLALSNMPIVNSNVMITNLEVWVAIDLYKMLEMCWHSKIWVNNSVMYIIRPMYIPVP